MFAFECEMSRTLQQSVECVQHTNAATDSKGRTWGLEGSLFWWLVGGVGVAIIVFFVLLVMMNTSLLTAFLVALLQVGQHFLNTI